MKSGLEGRNNTRWRGPRPGRNCLNEVRPRRPEQSAIRAVFSQLVRVSMKSGLEGRNNQCTTMEPLCN